MSKRRGLGRGLGALIPAGVGVHRSERPVDVFFPGPPPADPKHRDASEVPSPVAEDAVAGDGAAEAPVVNDAAADDGRPAAGRATGSVVSGVGWPGALPAALPTSAVVSRETELVPVPGARFLELPVRSIRPNPRQPRQVFDEDELAELAHSVRAVGVLQPVVVRQVLVEQDPSQQQRTGQQRTEHQPIEQQRTGQQPIGKPGGADLEAAEQYELVMGERRWRASQLAGLTTVPAIVRDTADDDLLRDALLENLHRSQLNALEEAAAYTQLLEDFGCTHDELARRVGKSRPQISNTMRLLRLPPPVQRRVAAGVLSAGHARALLGLENAAAIDQLAARIVAEGLSVRAVEEMVALGGAQASARAPRPRAGARSPKMEQLAAELADRLDTRVSIALGRRKGRLTVEFASVEDLERILAVLEGRD